MLDVWSALGWWDNWQLRILVLGSLGIRWFLLVAAPMRKYRVWRCFRLCIWLAYIGSDALTIYALATLYNRHARATSSSSCCDGIASNRARILEVLWAPVLLIHLGGQEAPMAIGLEENDLWIRHSMTLVSQVAIALYAFGKSWHNPRDWKLLASEILLFIIGVISCCEKPWVHKKASINNRLASVSAKIQGTKKRTRLAVYFHDLLFSTKSGEELAGEEDNVVLSEADKVNMVLLDMSLSAAADDLVRRGRARNVRDVLRPLSFMADKELMRVMRQDLDYFADFFSLDYSIRTYLVYRVLLVPILHIAALTLFVRSDKDGYDRTDVKITYILLCLTAALDAFAVFVRRLVHWAMSANSVPALWQSVPGYNLLDAVLRRRNKATGWLLKCATSMGCKEEYFDYCNCKGGRQYYTSYKDVWETVLIDLVNAQGRDLANYRVFTVPYGSGTAELPADHGDAEITCSQEESSQRQDNLFHLSTVRASSSSPGAAKAKANWALREEQQKLCGPKIRSTLRASFDRSVLVWHIATDLCFRIEGSPPASNQEDLRWFHIKRTDAISSYMARLLNSHPDMLLTGSRRHLVKEAMDEFESILRRTMVDDSGKPPGPEDLSKIIDVGEEARFHLNVPIGDKGDQYKEVPIAGRKTTDFHIPEACSLAKELLAIDDASMRWLVMYRVWVGMLLYSASMCRGYLHAKNLAEGGEFLSFVWLVLCLKGAKTLPDKLQMPEGDDDQRPEFLIDDDHLNLLELLNQLNPPDASVRSPMPTKCFSGCFSTTGSTLGEGV